MSSPQFATNAARWITRPEQRGWLVLGFGFYIITATWQILADAVSMDD